MFSLFRKPFTLSLIALLFLIRFSFVNHKKKTFIRYFSWVLYTKHTRCLVRHFDSHWVKPLTTNTSSNSNFYNADLRDVATERLYTTVGYETVSRTELNRWLGPSQPERDSISAAPPAALTLSLPLSLRHSIRSSMCVTHLLHVTTFSLSLSLDVFLSALLAIALSCERSSQSRSIAMAVALAPVCAGFKIFGKYHFPIPVFPSQVLAVGSVSVSLLLFAVLLFLRLPLHLQASQV